MRAQILQITEQLKFPTLWKRFPTKVMGRQRRSLLGRDLIRASRVVRRDGGGGGVLLQEGRVAFAPHGAD